MPYVLRALLLCTGLAVIAFTVVETSAVQLPQQVDGPPVDDSHLLLQEEQIELEANALTYNLEASSSLDIAMDDYERIRLHVNGSEWDTVFVNEVLERNRVVFTLMAVGNECRRFLVESTDSLWRDYPPIEFVWIGRLMSLSALQHMRSGNSQMTVEALKEVIRFAYLYEQDSVGLPQHLVGLLLHERALDVLWQSLESGVILPNQEIELLEFLKRRQITPLGFKRAMMDEYKRLCIVLDADSLTETAAKTDETYAPVGYQSYHPNNTKRLLASQYTLLLQQADSSLNRWENPGKLVEVQRTIVDKVIGQKFLHIPNIIGYIYLTTQANTTFTAIKKYEAIRRYCMLGYRAAATIVALRIYRHKHGSLPYDLADLVPDYLEEIPIDPFDGQPLRYMKGQGIVYSVGLDFLDNHGLSDQLPAHHEFLELLEVSSFIDNLNHKDLVFRLI